MTAEKDKKKNDRTLDDVAVAAGNSEVVSRYGSANAEFIKGYSGVDNEIGAKPDKFKRYHKKIYNYKINNEYEKENIKQQAGFSAEVAKVSRDNADNIINNNKKRIIRTEDHPDFGANDTVYDHIETIGGNVIQGSGSQMKFVGDPKSLIDKIATGEGGGNNDLSRYLDAKLDLPSDQLDPAAYREYCKTYAENLRKDAELLESQGEKDKAQKKRGKANKIEKGKDIGLREYCKNKAKELRTQADKLEEQGKHELAAKKRQQADNYDKVSSNMRDSGLTTKEAEFYRRHPKIATAVDMGKTAHRGGLEAAKYGAVIGGAVSLIKNGIAYRQGDKELKEVLCDTAVDTGKSALVGYGTGFAGSLAKSVMQQSGSGLARQLSRTSLPALVVSTTLALAASISRYAKGEIDSVQFMEEIGEKGSGMLASGMMATLGQIAIPIPVVGGVIGGMVGYTMSSLFYRSSLQAFQEAKEAEINYQTIKAQCEEARRRMIEYQTELQLLFDIHMADMKLQLSDCFTCMDRAVDAGSMDEFAEAANSMGSFFGKTLQFNSMQEFDDFMSSDKTLIL
jgi:hypothetical protein